MKQSEQIDNIRRSKRMTIKALCKEVGVTQQTYQNFMDRPKVTLETLEKFADALGKKLVLVDKE